MALGMSALHRCKITGNKNDAYHGFFDLRADFRKSCGVLNGE